MASLDLQPDLPLMVVQAVVFAISFFIVVYFFISPYLALRKARDKETEGASQKAGDFVLQAKETEKAIEKRLKEAFESAKEVRKKAEQRGQQEYKNIVAKARKRSEEHVLQVTKEVQLALKQERQKVAKEATLLTGLLSSLLIPKEKV